MDHVFCVSAHKVGGAEESQYIQSVLKVLEQHDYTINI